jgi:FMN-dependent oxidoreductase (nitrilotriacetate monooxygenase family)
MDRQQMHLGVYAVGTGNHIAGWRYPGATTSGEDFEAFKNIAASAERGKLDFVFVGDTLAFQSEGHPGQILRFEPTTLLSALASVTSHIGLVGTASTSYSEPFNIARQFASLDHLSGGRAGWNVVTSTLTEAIANFGREAVVEHDLRYEIAAEFVDVVQGLWDTWEDGARILNRETGQYYDPSKVHVLDHKGKYFSVKGPLNLTRTPQGRPIIVQAGSSNSGQQLAARYAEIIFTVQLDKDESCKFYDGVKKQVIALGRRPGHCNILPGLVPVVGRTDDEARAKLAQLMTYVDPTSAMKTMSRRFGHDMSKYPLDGPVPDLPLSNLMHSYNKVASAKAKRLGYKLRDIYNEIAVARGYLLACGSPTTVADLMAEWFKDSAADGFILLPAHFPEAFDDFIDFVIPELQGRGLFRKDYQGTTLRDHLGLPKPESRFTRAS